MAEVPNAIWKGLFEWSMQQQGDGTTSEARPLAEADRHWLEDALKSAMVDLGRRMQDIKASLDAGTGGAAGGTAAAGSDEAAAAAALQAEEGASLEQKEQLLDELQDLIESIDLAKDLHTIGGLHTLLGLLASPHPSLRWRAAEVAATCAQNNPDVQAAFMEGGIMPSLLPLLHDEHPTVQTKALMAISCMVRGYPPALLLLRGQGGLGTLVGLLGSRQEEPRLQRKCLQVMQYMLRVVPLDRRPAACDARLLPALGALLAGEDADLREAALAVAQQLAADDGSLRRMQQDAGFITAVETLQMRLDTLPQEDWGSAQEEAAAATQLAAALHRDLPPQSAEEEEAAAAALAAAAAAVVDDSSTSGAPPAALQLMALPAAPTEPAN